MRAVCGEHFHTSPQIGQGYVLKTVPESRGLAAHVASLVEGGEGLMSEEQTT